MDKISAASSASLGGALILQTPRVGTASAQADAHAHAAAWFNQAVVDSTQALGLPLPLSLHGAADADALCQRFLDCLLDHDQGHGSA